MTSSVDLPSVASSPLFCPSAPALWGTRKKLCLERHQLRPGQQCETLELVRPPDENEPNVGTRPCRHRRGGRPIEHWGDAQGSSGDHALPGPWPSDLS